MKSYKEWQINEGKNTHQCPHCGRDLAIKDNNTQSLIGPDNITVEPRSNMGDGRTVRFGPPEQRPAISAALDRLRNL